MEMFYILILMVVYPVVYICQNASNCTLKTVAYYCRQMTLNKYDIQKKKYSGASEQMSPKKNLNLNLIKPLNATTNYRK